MTALLIEKFSGSIDAELTTDRDRLCLELGSDSYVLDRTTAVRLRDQLGTALRDSREFVRTVGTHRADGSYVVSRRDADSSGQSKVFDSFEAAVRRYESLPDEFTATDVGETGLTGSRRHLFVWHVVEHPAFSCELLARQPLTVRKAALSAETDAADDRESIATATMTD